MTNFIQFTTPQFPYPLNTEDCSSIGTITPNTLRYSFSTERAWMSFQENLVTWSPNLPACRASAHIEYPFEKEQAPFPAVPKMAIYYVTFEFPLNEPLLPYYFSQRVGQLGRALSNLSKRQIEKPIPLYSNPWRRASSTDLK